MPQRSGTVLVTVRYFAAAKAAAGVPEEQLELPGVGSTIGDLLALAVDRHGPALSRVLPRCSFLLDEIAVHGPDTVIIGHQTVDVLPPFAGG